MVEVTLCLLVNITLWLKNKNSPKWVAEVNNNWKKLTSHVSGSLSWANLAMIWHCYLLIHLKMLMFKMLLIKRKQWWRSTEKKLILELHFWSKSLLKVLKSLKSTQDFGSLENWNTVVLGRQRVSLCVFFSLCCVFHWSIVDNTENSNTVLFLDRG